MNYVVALLLFYIKDEEQVFWCLYQLMIKYNCRQMYVERLPKVHEMGATLDNKLKVHLPKVRKHLLTTGMTVLGTFTSHLMDFCV